jgi:hypothetical protein
MLSIEPRYRDARIRSGEHVDPGDPHIRAGGHNEAGNEAIAAPDVEHCVRRWDYLSEMLGEHARSPIVHEGSMRVPKQLQCPTHGAPLFTLLVS